MAIPAPELTAFIVASERTIPLTSSWTQLLQPNDRRTAILWMNTANQKISVWPFSMSGTTGTRIVVPDVLADNNFILVASKEFGPIVRNGWWGRKHTGATESITIIEYTCRLDYVEWLDKALTPVPQTPP